MPLPGRRRSSAAPPNDPLAAQPEPEALGTADPAAPGAAPAETLPSLPAAAEPQPEPRTQIGGMIPTRSSRSAVESFFMRLIATGGILGIGVVISAIMTNQHSKGWLIGLV